MEIVGVVRTVRYGSVRRRETCLRFTPFEQGGIPTFCTLLIRTSAPNVTGLITALFVTSLL